MHIRICAHSIRYFVFLQNQADLIKETVEAMPEESPPLFDPLGEGVDLSELAAASAAESAVDPGSSRRGTVSEILCQKNMSIQQH